MSYPSVAPSEYYKVAAEKGLELMSAPPASVRDQIVWRCLTCGTLHTKTLRAVRQSQNGCSCNKEESLGLPMYLALAERLGVDFVGTLRPRNTKTQTLWRNRRTLLVVTASYYDLAYHHIVIPLRQQLGIMVWVALPVALRNIIKLLRQTEVEGADHKPVLVTEGIPLDILERLEQLAIIKKVKANRTSHFVFTPIGDRLLTEASRIDKTYVKKERIATRAHNRREQKDQQQYAGQPE